MPLNPHSSGFLYSPISGQAFLLSIICSSPVISDQQSPRSGADCLCEQLCWVVGRSAGGEGRSGHGEGWCEESVRNDGLS